MAFALAAGSRAHAVDITPVFKAGAMGGQYFLYGNKASLSGNANALYAPLLTYNERWAMIPLISSNYQGTKGVDDGTLAGSLFQQQMDHRVSLTGIYSMEGTQWKLKPSGSYRRVFVKETLDETWGQGLFDYEKIATGLTAEKTYLDPFSYSMSLDFYRLRFPNYVALEANAGTDPTGNPLSRQNTNSNVLDTLNTQLSFSGSRPFPYDQPVVSLQGSYSILWQRYTDQNLIDLTGGIGTKSRQDFLQNLSFSVSYPRAVHFRGDEYRLTSTWMTNFSYNGSNQNTFDATFTRFEFDSWSYYSWGMGPNVSLAWGDPKRPAMANLSFLYTDTQYFGRLAQNADGAYTVDSQWQDTYRMVVGYSYPLASGFYLKAQGNFMWGTSNQAFNQFYAYTFRTANYLMGFSYDY